jgi:hypothetical protein
MQTIKNNNRRKLVLKLFTALLLFSVYFNGLFVNGLFDDVQYGDKNFYYHPIFTIFLNLTCYIFMFIVYSKRKGEGDDYLKIKKSILSLDICIVSLFILLSGFPSNLTIEEWFSHILHSCSGHLILLFLFDTIENS